MISMLDAFDVLKKYKLSLAPYKVVTDLDHAIKAAHVLDYPVVMKAVSHKVSHKTEYGLVRTGITDDDDVAQAWKVLVKRMALYKIPFETILVQKQMKGYELIIGGKKDKQFGQVIIFGLGGIYVEVFKDISARICPITENDASEMLREIKAHPILKGLRGHKPVKETGLIDALMKTSKLLVHEDPEEVDLNPLFADDKGYHIVDARIVYKKKR